MKFLIGFTTGMQTCMVAFKVAEIVTASWWLVLTPAVVILAAVAVLGTVSFVLEMT